ncbi:MAG: hypothetical protein OXU45_06475 [Candidatus Melainabacteria bacterium]|nr:hypothetical protein [Candidatus Melainabacteria bacterium]
MKPLNLENARACAAQLGDFISRALNNEEAKPADSITTKPTPPAVREVVRQLSLPIIQSGTRPLSVFQDLIAGLKDSSSQVESLDSPQIQEKEGEENRRLIVDLIRELSKAGADLKKEYRIDTHAALGQARLGLSANIDSPAGLFSSTWRQGSDDCESIVLNRRPEAGNNNGRPYIKQLFFSYNKTRPELSSCIVKIEDPQGQETQEVYYRALGINRSNRQVEQSNPLANALIETFYPYVVQPLFAHDGASPIASETGVEQPQDFDALVARVIERCPDTEISSKLKREITISQSLASNVEELGCKTTALGALPLDVHKFLEASNLERDLVRDSNADHYAQFLANTNRRLRLFTEALRLSGLEISPVPSNDGSCAKNSTWSIEIDDGSKLQYTRAKDDEKLDSVELSLACGDGYSLKLSNSREFPHQMVSLTEGDDEKLVASFYYYTVEVDSQSNLMIERPDQQKDNKCLRVKTFQQY